MKHYGVFDMIGPVMVGPSSSHTAGAARLGLFARHLCGEEIKKAVFYMHGSFAETYAGLERIKRFLQGYRGSGMMMNGSKALMSWRGRKGFRQNLFLRIWERCIPIRCIWSSPRRAAMCLP